MFKRCVQCIILICFNKFNQSFDFLFLILFQIDICELFSVLKIKFYYLKKYYFSSIEDIQINIT